MLTSFYFLILLLLKSSNAPQIQDCGSPNKALFVKFNHWREARYLCPAASEADRAKLKNLAQYYTPLRYCLFESLLIDQHEKLCSSKVNPIFAAHLDNQNNPLRCGHKKYQYLHYFGYYEFDHFFEEHKPIPISTFDVCFDVSNKKTVYTTHILYHASYYQNPQFVERPYCEEEISTDPFYMNANQFLNVQKLYNSQSTKSGQAALQMIPYPMVPSEYFATWEFKKTTNHYINRAHLWKNLAPLMTLVDHGIKKAAYQVFIKRSELEPDEKLFVYTRTLRYEKHESSLLRTFKRLFERKSFQPSIWYKLLYNKVKREAILIYIHNIPSYNKKPIVKQCAEDMQFNCDLRVWSDTADFWETNPSINLDYVYCCKVTSQYAETIFFDFFDIENVFDINSLIKNSIQ